MMTILSQTKKLGAVSALILFASMPIALAAQANDAQVQADVQKSLGNKRFSGVQVAVGGGVVRLSGSVGKLEDKLDAEKKAEQRSAGNSVKDEIAVTGGDSVSDAELFQKLGKALAYDRVGYGTTMFNAISLDVHQGVVTITGMVVDPADKESALGLIKGTTGVRGLVDKLEIAPVSPLDNRIRAAEARAIYGAPQLNRYAQNPAKPIRISVANGHVTLTGMVDSEADKNIAGIRANGVAGVFSVENHIQVAGKNE